MVYSTDGSIWIWREGGQPKRITFGSMDERPRISTDGKLVVFKRGYELYAVNTDGTNFHILVSTELLKGYTPTGGVNIYPKLYEWLPGTHDLYFTDASDYPDQNFFSFYYTFDLFLAKVDTGEVRQIMPKKLGGLPYYSPDAKTIAVVQPDVIYLIDPDGGRLRTGLSFEKIVGYSEFSIIPTIVPLPDSSGFRVIFPTGDYLSQRTAENTYLWNIPIQGRA